MVVNFFPFPNPDNPKILTVFQLGNQLWFQLEEFYELVGASLSEQREFKEGLDSCYFLFVRKQHKLGYSENTWFINEGGLSSFLSWFSENPLVKTLRKWIYMEVVPCFRGGSMSMATPIKMQEINLLI